MSRRSEVDRRRSLPSRQRMGRPPLNGERQFTEVEVRIERLILAEDMLVLILQEGQALPAQMRKRLLQVYEGLSVIRRQVSRS